MYRDINTLIKCYKVPTREIGFINSIIDSYEGIAGLRTLDEKNGYIEVWISPFFEKEFENIINDLRHSIEIVKI